MSQSDHQEQREALLESFIQFNRPEKYIPLPASGREEEAAAGFFGLALQTYQSVVSRFDHQAEQAAGEVLKDSEFLELLSKLPFSKSHKIAVLADALTDDLQGWFAIFRHILDLGVPGAAFEYIDASTTDTTSSEALRRIEGSVLVHKPDWVIIALGSEDAMRPNITTGRCLVSLAEFWENINTLESAVLANCSNPPVWITPPPALGEQMQKSPLLPGMVLEEDLKKYREVVAGKKGIVVDPTGTRMGNPPSAWNYMNDGFHLSLAGHVQTVKTLLKAVASG